MGLQNLSSDNLDDREKVEEPVVTKDTWVQCDSCNKWRRIPAIVADQLADDAKWHCQDNPNLAFASCDVPQELTNEEIDRAEEEEELVERENSYRARGRMPVLVQVLKDNVFSHRKRKVQDEDDIMICQCKPVWRGGDGCGPDCINRLLCIECVPGFCPCEEHCTNQVFSKKQFAKLDVKRAGPKGFGLFAAEDIKAGQFIIEYVGEVLEEEEYLRRKEFYQEVGQRHYYFMNIGNGEVIDACRKGNNARFINHSCDPNCETQKWLIRGELAIGLFALKDMAAGDELTFDYNFERYGDKPIRCHCSTKTCRKFIGGTPDQWDESAPMVEDPDASSDLPPVMVQEEDMDANIKAILDWRVGTEITKERQNMVLGRLQVLCQSKNISWTTADFGDADLDQVLSGAVAAVDQGPLGVLDDEADISDDDDDHDDDRVSTRAKPASSRYRGAKGNGKQKQVAIAVKKSATASSKQASSTGSKKAGPSKVAAASASGGVPSSASVTTTASIGESSEVQPLGSGFRGPLKAAFKHWKAKQDQPSQPEVTLQDDDVAAVLEAVKGMPPRKRFVSSSSKSATTASHNQQSAGSTKGGTTAAAVAGEDLSASSSLTHQGASELVSMSRKVPPQAPVPRGRSLSSNKQHESGSALKPGAGFKRRSEIDRRLDSLIGQTGRLRDPSKQNIVKVLRMFNLCDIAPAAAAAAASKPPMSIPQSFKQEVFFSPHQPAVKKEEDAQGLAEELSISNKCGKQEVEPMVQSTGFETSEERRGVKSPPHESEEAGPGPGSLAIAAAALHHASGPSLAGAAANHQVTGKQRARMADMSLLLDIVLKTSSQTVKKDFVTCGILNQLHQAIGRNLSREYSMILRKILRVVEQLPLSANDIYGVRSAHGTFADLLQELSQNVDFDVRSKAAFLIKKFPLSACTDPFLVQQHSGGMRGGAHALGQTTRVPPDVVASPFPASQLTPSQMDTDWRSSTGIERAVPPSSGNRTGRPMRPMVAPAPPPRPPPGLPPLPPGLSPLPLMMPHLRSASPPLELPSEVFLHDRDSTQSRDDKHQSSLKRQRTSTSSLAGSDVDRSVHSAGSSQEGRSGQGDQLQQLPPLRQTLPLKLTAEHLFERLHIEDNMNDAMLRLEGADAGPRWPHGEPTSLETAFVLRLVAGWDEVRGALLDLEHVQAQRADKLGAMHCSTHCSTPGPTHRGLRLPPKRADSPASRPHSTEEPPLSPLSHPESYSPLRQDLLAPQPAAVVTGHRSGQQEQAGEPHQMSAVPSLLNLRTSWHPTEAASNGTTSGYKRHHREDSDTTHNVNLRASLHPPGADPSSRDPDPSLAYGASSSDHHTVRHQHGHESSSQKAAALLGSIHHPSSGSHVHQQLAGQQAAVLPRTHSLSSMVSAGAGGSTPSKSSGGAANGVSIFSPPVYSSYGHTVATAATPGNISTSGVPEKALRRARSPSWEIWSRPVSHSHPETWEAPNEAFERFVAEMVQHRIGKYAQPDHPNRISNEEAMILNKKIQREIIEKERHAFQERQEQALHRPMERKKLEGNIKEFVRLSIRRFHSQH